MAVLRPLVLIQQHGAGVPHLLNAAVAKLADQLKDGQDPFFWGVRGGEERRDLKLRGEEKGYLNEVNHHDTFSFCFRMRAEQYRQ